MEEIEGMERGGRDKKKEEERESVGRREIEGRERGGRDKK